MTAAEAAALAKRAGVGRLLLTHLHPLIDTCELLAEARAVFAPSALVDEMAVYKIT